MKFDFSRLRGKIREQGKSQADLCAEIGMSTATLSLKLSGKSDFRQEEIMAIAKTLGIAPKQIPYFFFCEKVQKN